jgi:hypothetical protein
MEELGPPVHTILNSVLICVFDNVLNDELDRNEHKKLENVYDKVSNHFITDARGKVTTRETRGQDS